MAHAGMVHALETIHTLLKPDGALIDIHPVPEGYLIKVFQGGQTLFAERKRDTLSEDVLAAEEAIAIVLKRGLYTLEKAEEIDYLTYSSSTNELQEYWAEQSSFDDRPVDAAIATREEQLFALADQIMQRAGDEAQVAIHERAKIALLRP